MNIKGIDVSVWQGKIDWKKVKASGIVFAMIRVGYGSSQGNDCKMDTYFKANVEGALAAGVEVGIYFYSYAKSAQAAAREAAWVVEQIAPYKGRILYPVAYDLEDSKQAGLGRDVLTAMVTAFCTTIEAAGYYASFYCNTNWCKNMLNMDDLKGFDLWLAQWASQPTTAYSFGMWQRSSSGSVAGINGRVDLDVAYKDYAASNNRAVLNEYKETVENRNGIVESYEFEEPYADIGDALSDDYVVSFECPHCGEIVWGENWIRKTGTNLLSLSQCSDGQEYLISLKFRPIAENKVVVKRLVYALTDELRTDYQQCMEQAAAWSKYVIPAYSF